MDVEIFTLCDYSQDMQGKLVIVGTFDTLNVRELPAIHPACSVAARIRFENVEAGPHQLRLMILDPNNGNVVPPLDANMEIRISPNTNTATANFIINLNQIRFSVTGRYSINLFIDGAQRKSLPFFVNRGTN